VIRYTHAAPVGARRFATAAADGSGLRRPFLRDRLCQTGWLVIAGRASGEAAAGIVSRSADRGCSHKNVWPGGTGRRRTTELPRSVHWVWLPGSPVWLPGNQPQDMISDERERPREPATYSRTPGAVAGPTGDPDSPVADREAPVGCPRLDTADRSAAPIYGRLLSSAGRVLQPSPRRPTDEYRTHLDEPHRPLSRPPPRVARLLAWRRSASRSSGSNDPPAQRPRGGAGVRFGMRHGTSG
jgi:hypothetical protein